MLKDLAQEAIMYALSGNWGKALSINKQILKDSPIDIDSLNRLARAYSELGEFQKAKKTVLKVLKIDPYNKIATKSLEKWKIQGESPQTKQNTTKYQASSQTFLEEPGKTKLVKLIYLGDRRVTSQLDSGDKVNITCHHHKVTVISQMGRYIGKLPDDIAARLRKLIRDGYKYESVINSANTYEVKVFIREIAKGQSLQNTPSFPPEKISYVSFTPPELVRKKDEIENFSLEAES